MEPTDQEELLADVAKLVCAIDADDVATLSSLDALLPEVDAGASLLAPFEASSDEWLFFEDVLDTTTEPTTIDTEAGEDRTDITRHATAATSSCRVKTTRDRQKAELVYLKDRVRELERQLHDLRHEKTVNDEDSLHEDNALTHEIVLREGVKQFWQRQAEGERRARERSIAENARLRQALEGQLRLAKSLARLLRKRPCTDGSLAGPSGTSSKLHRLHEAGDSEIFDYLMRDMDMRYAQVDAVLLESGLSSRQTTHEDARFVDANRDASRAAPWYLEFVDSVISPFDYRVVRDVTWHAMCTPTIPLDHGVYNVLETTHDVIKADVRIKIRVGNSDVIGRGRFVTRRYIEENRLVLVWAVWSTTEGGLPYDQQIRLVLQGWGVVCPLEGAPACTLIQRCARMRPNMAIKKSSKLEAHVGLLTDVLLGTYHDILRGLNDHMGRMMVEAARGPV